MSSDPTARRLLPQSSQMTNFSFAPQQYQQPRETQKNYVFVDEHNRHKRLKVMRACEGCRRRKIKCDAATTNTWPCSACIRLKLHCVRPNGYDGAAEPQVFEPTRPEYETAGVHDFRQHLPMHQPHMLAGAPSHASMYAPKPGMYSEPSGLYQPLQYPDHSSANGLHYTTVPPVGVVDQTYAQASQQAQQPSVFPTPPMQQASRPDSPPEVYNQDQYGQQDLSDLLGTLKLNDAGTAPYLNHRLRLKSQVDEEPLLPEDDEYKTSLPPLVAGPGLKVRIPPELMPDDETALEYFDVFFANIHPYVPVLDRTAFYRQWQNDRESMSPLVLEAIFALAGRIADEPGEGQQWLALATRHADSFMDMPRLSTLQALLLILKAREAAPRRGYFYRSWMSIVQCVQMGKELGLDDHFEDHKAGRPCGSSAADCTLKTRIWQTIFVCETMIGSSQGRTDLSVDLDSVDFGLPRPFTSGDDSDYQVTRNFTYLARVVRNIARMNRVYSRIHKHKDWGCDPDFVQINPEASAWLNDLPPDLCVNEPPDGSPPWLASSFIGNLHSYYHLSVILLHRPQLTHHEPTGMDGQWKQHMMLCYNSAKTLCRLQEAVLQTFGLSGLQCMQRGINFTLYCILSCIVLHLVALTSPDPDLNTDAREYFTRHMRLLEKCMHAWPMPDMQNQIDSIREAFSADVRKPFVMKASFPYGSPHSTSRPSPPRPNPTNYRPSMPRGSVDQHHQQQTIDTQSAIQHAQVSYPGQHPITPPISAGPLDMKSDSPAALQLPMMASVSSAGQTNATQAPTMQSSMAMTTDGGSGWNPSRIFDQWNNSFGTPPVQSAAATNTPPHHSSLSIPSSGAAEIPSIQDIQHVHSTVPSIAAAAAQISPHQQYSAAPVQTFVTPAMWQESVASVYEGGLKRTWDYDANGLPLTKRR
ncbi:Cutinase transcription factor 1 alpha [Cytospora mali]|uniref:Cutinase transcription factor 1 alpha n=1 Tax=Cytospora mali TaxID=578113 RepID=A0A194USR5_CYTMA|nr:Cutinase transcription factor 1 alpha [Valsa mali var. pyri (nom. inval.)]